MKNLKILDACGNSGINDESLIDLDLVELDASGNPKITNISHLKNLKILGAIGNSGISDKSLIGLNLIKLNADDNPKISFNIKNGSKYEKHF